MSCEIPFLLRNFPDYLFQVFWLDSEKTEDTEKIQAMHNNRRLL